MVAVSSSNKRIAKNTAFLYIRMVVTMLISLYTSRVLLKILGVDDFGIYGLVGGIVTMFASLKTMFTAATQRYLNIEIGRGDDRELNKVFNISLLINIIISVVFIIIVEIGGIWLLEHKLKIAPERFSAANWVFQFSVLSAAIHIIGIPYNANIIAREKMDVLAIVSILDAFLKLGIVFLLPVFSGDRLIIYGVLMLCITLLNLAISVFYCRVKFKESKLHIYSFTDIKQKFKEMFAFSGWAFLGNVAFALVNEGINILLNIFGGVVANAARAVAYQVRGAINSLVTNVYTAVKPQAIQSYAKKDINRFYKLMFTGGKLVGYFYILLAIPLFFTLKEVLELWLGTIPEYAVVFLSTILLYQLVRVLHESVGSFFVTIGRLKEYQITEFFALGLALPVSYVGLKFFNMPLYGVFLIMTVSEIVNLGAILILANRIGGFDIKLFVLSVLLPYGMMSIACFVSAFLIKMAFGLVLINVYVKTIIIIIAIVLVQAIWLYFAGLTKEERNLLINLIKRK